MKKLCIGIGIGIFLVLTVASMRQQDTGILITGGFAGEPKLQANQPNQSAPWIVFDNFQLPSSGILPVAYGGTGTNSAAATIAASIVFTATNGVLYTNRIINGTIR